MMDSDSIAKYLLVSAIVLFVIVFFKWLKRFLRRKEIQQKYAYLYPLENKQLNNISLRIEMPFKGDIAIFIYDSFGNLQMKTDAASFDKGEHKFELNIKELPKGKYDLIIHTPHQKIRRYFEIDTEVY